MLRSPGCGCPAESPGCYATSLSLLQVHRLNADARMLHSRGKSVRSTSSDDLSDTSRASLCSHVNLPAIQALAWTCPVSPTVISAPTARDDYTSTSTRPKQRDTRHALTLIKKDTRDVREERGIGRDGRHPISSLRVPTPLAAATTYFLCCRCLVTESVTTTLCLATVPHPSHSPGFVLKPPF